MPEQQCPWWYPGKAECMIMTRLLQTCGVVGFHATMESQTRTCLGLKKACYFRDGPPKDKLSECPYCGAELCPNCQTGTLIPSEKNPGYIVCTNCGRHKSEHE